MTTPSSPIHLDIGCARGRCLLGLSELIPDWNHLGVEIRRPLVTAAERDRDRLEHHNVRILFCNANISLEGWMAALEEDQLQRVSIQFPDPWFKRRHRKRRVQPALLLAIAGTPTLGASCSCRAMFSNVIEPMVALTELSDCFDRPAEDQRPWRASNPLPVPTSASATCLSKTSPSTACSIAGTRIHVQPNQIWNSAGNEIDNPAETAPTS